MEKLTKEDLKYIVGGACDVVLAVIIAGSKIREEALEGVEALRRDMVRNVNLFYDKEKKLR